MIKKNHCILLGTLTKPHGTKGSVLIWLNDLKAEDIKRKGTVFVEIDGLLVPFFMENFLNKTEDCIILKLKGMDTETRAKELAGSTVFVLPDQIRKKRQLLPVLPRLSGYRVRDLQTGFEGIAAGITGVSSNPLLKVNHEGHEYLVPIHEEIILDINDEEKTILIRAPEGLFEL